MCAFVQASLRRQLPVVASVCMLGQERQAGLPRVLPCHKEQGGSFLEV